jgi:DNA polymerase delta subunit 3
MLYDYHTYQNGIKAESIHATYVVYGTKTQDSTAEDGDVEMGSSMPEHEPLSETVPTTTLALVRQENLEGTETLKRASSMN